MSIQILSCCTRRAVVAVVNRTLTCSLNNSYSCVHCAAPTNQAFLQKFNRLGRAWVFPLIVDHSENVESGFKPIGKLRFLFTSATMDSFQADKKRFVEMPFEKKRDHYKCSKYTDIGSILTWPLYYKYMSSGQASGQGSDTATEQPSSRADLSNKVSMWEGDITSLEIDAIVNAANRSLLGGGGVDGAIHRGAGPSLLSECKTLGGCETGEAKITGGYRLPAKYVIHTVGPQGEHPDKLRNCYRNCLQKMKEQNLHSIAFPCISTGVYGYPNESAAHVALDTTKQWLAEGNNKENVDRIIFCLFMPQDIEIYKKLLKEYFPPH